MPCNARHLKDPPGQLRKRRDGSVTFKLGADIGSSGFEVILFDKIGVQAPIRQSIPAEFTGFLQSKITDL